jgi:antirestriction protein ArdC
MSDKADSVHAEITQAFIAALEAGIENPTKWSPPWAKGPDVMSPYNPVSGHHYAGGNRMICAIHSWIHDLGRQWATYDQWASMSVHTDECYAGRAIGKDKYSKPEQDVCREYGCVLVNVRRGERAICTLLRPLKFKEVNDAGVEVERIKAWAPFKVFNASQVSGFEAEAPLTTGIVDISVDQAFEFAAIVGAEIEESPVSGASFAPRPDKIVMPARNRWTEPERCFSTICHELTHWTGHPHRLDRQPQRMICEGIAYSPEDYAREELVAELGAAFLCAEFDRTSDTRDDHLHYLKAWLKILREDPKALWSASGKAQAATTYLTRLHDANVVMDDPFMVIAEMQVEVD